MEIYLKLFEVLFPVFFVVGIGYYLGKNNPKIDTTFITNFAANIGSPAMIIYSLTCTGTSFEIFKNYFWYYLIGIIAFAIIGIIAIEAGLLTPPFGLLVYTVKAAIHGEGDNVQVMSIFKSSTPYWMIMLVCMVAIIVFPEIATYLPDVLF